MGIFVLTATYELRVSRKIHLRDHPTCLSCVGYTSDTSISNTDTVPSLGGGGGVRYREIAAVAINWQDKHVCEQNRKNVGRL
jgi:hypothetical protein